MIHLIGRMCHLSAVVIAVQRLCWMPCRGHTGVLGRYMIVSNASFLYSSATHSTPVTHRNTNLPFSSIMLWLIILCVAMAVFFVTAMFAYYVSSIGFRKWLALPTHMQSFLQQISPILITSGTQTIQSTPSPLYWREGYPPDLTGTSASLLGCRRGHYRRDPTAAGPLVASYPRYPQLITRHPRHTRPLRGWVLQRHWWRLLGRRCRW